MGKIPTFELSPEGIRQAMEFASRTSWNRALDEAILEIARLLIDENRVPAVIRLGLIYAMNDLKIHKNAHTNGV